MDKPAVYAQVTDEQTGVGAVHVAAAEGRATIIKVRFCFESGQHGQPRLRGQSWLGQVASVLKVERPPILTLPGFGGQ